MADEQNTANESQTATSGGLNLSESMPGAELGEVLLGGESQHTDERRLREAKPADKHGWWWAVGRRKNAVARIRMKVSEGSGSVKIQKTQKKFKSIDEYFTETQDRSDCIAPLKVTGTKDNMEIVVRVHGGGHTGQAQAIRLGIARALRDYDPTLEDALREHGYLTVDDRRVERKKYGQPGARKRFQFSKR